METSWKGASQSFASLSLELLQQFSALNSNCCLVVLTTSLGHDLLETAGEAHLATCTTRYCCQLALRRTCSFCPSAAFVPDSHDSPPLLCFSAEASLQDLQLLKMSLCFYFVFPSAQTGRVWHLDPFTFGKGSVGLCWFCRHRSSNSPLSCVMESI